MSVFSSLASLTAKRRGKPSSGIGWIGVDIGTRAIKLAQIQRVVQTTNSRLAGPYRRRLSRP